MRFPPALDTRKAHAGERDMLFPAATAALEVRLVHISVEAE
jgi:hypothetical protein